MDFFRDIFAVFGDLMMVVFWEIGILVIALSADALAAGLAYGAGGIRLPIVSLATACGVSSLILTLSLLTGEIAGEMLPAGAVKMFGFLMLAALGFWKLLAHTDGESAREADKNKDRLVSPMEALALGAALSADSLAAGVGAGALDMPLLPAVFASFLAGAAALLAGQWMGRRLSAWRAAGRRKGGHSGAEGAASQSGNHGFDAERVSGLLLLILAAAKLF